MARKEPTPEQKQAAAEKRDRMRKLAQEVGRMSDADRARLIDRLGTVATIEGHPLSIHNTCLLLMQNSRASIVGGFRQWQKSGRRVRKGERALSIWAPMRPRKNDDQDAPATPGQDSDARPRFRLVSVFDISQTDPIAATAAA